MEQFRWIDNHIDDTKIRVKLPTYQSEMIGQMEQADREANVAVFAQLIDDFEVATKWLVPDVLTNHEWDLLCWKYAFPPDK